MIKFLKLLANLIGIVLPAVSSITTYQGLVMANRLAEGQFAKETVPLIVSIAVCLLSIAFALFFINLYPLTENESAIRKKLNWLLGFVFLFTFLGQTYWSVTGIGGIPAISYHLSKMVDRGYEKLNEISAGVEETLTLKYGVDALVKQFDLLEDLEKKGMLSSHEGVGSVVLQIRVIKNSLANVSSFISSAYGEKGRIIKDARKTLQEAQGILDNSSTEIGYKISQFSVKLFETNHTFQKIQSLDITQVVSAVNGQLSKLSSILPPQSDNQIAKDQREAIKKLRSHVESAQEVVNKLAEQSRYSQAKIKLEQLSTISISYATLRYFWRIPGELAISVAIDIGPYAFVFFLLYMQPILRKREGEKRGVIYSQ
ncbi:hypothetical protein COV49_00095 [Candidatus Falkowbacteria bacterium CG11_big_fil_rev_8_21_14_0_20_39_10]|uniref:Uncharacterized protein n=1 Tax=Candidatus Falkowbacteria bacterium CG11_big_fil_rev_8_21_14_0_20_39_10 TaxID=1974570 RepID=A0A2M6KAF9_9BACT|nr:MAG: hypothetical protein COV49_00095 [Candidatus Falkowbacteria bacterium CG11_big_fil_rev_8_21_14_0_20_39_10]